MRALRFLVILCLLLVLAGAVFIVAAREPVIKAISPPAAASFDRAEVTRGAALAALGNCDVCHTAPGGAIFAGGRAVPTPFGTIYSTNITPDPETGIGTWPETAFRRALRDGVRRDGKYLYPAFPYDHFTLVSDADDKALYAFLMTRRPVHAVAPANRLPFPLSLRVAVFGWDLLFLHRGPYRPDSAQSETYNRGAYLVEGLGHCGACHTPRNLLGAEKSGQRFAGAEVEGWTAYALNAASPAAVPWTEAALADYLHRGFAQDHGVARGPMVEVAQDLRAAQEPDIRAIAAYIAMQMGNTGAPAPDAAAGAAAQNRRGRVIAAQSADSQAPIVDIGQADMNQQGAVIFATACSGCHGGPRAMPYGGIDLALSSGITGPSARNLANVVLYGLPAAAASRAPIMPGFAASLTDPQLVALANYLRAHFTAKEPWRGVEDDVRQARAAPAEAASRHAATGAILPLSSPQTDNHEAQR